MSMILEQNDTMTPVERQAALIAGEPIDRPPFNPMALGFCARVHGVDRGTYYRNPETAFEAGLSLMKAYPWMNTKPSYGWADRGAWEFGGGIGWPDNDRYAAPFVPAALITKPEQVDDLPDPDPLTAGMNALTHRFNEIARANGFGAGLPAGTPTTASAGIVGRSRFLRWMQCEPQAVHKVQRKVTDFIIATAKVVIERHGAENCGLFAGLPMECNQLISADQFSEFCKPYVQEIFGYYCEAGVKAATVHLCGDHTANLVHWRDIPLPPRTVFTIGHEMDMAVTSRAIGPEHILAGNIHNGILQAGEPAEVMAETRRALEQGMKHEGGFILMPACEIPPEMPLVNLEAMAQALGEYGYYR